MREIIYIQAGSLSNYIGTHYWNTQESYFVYDEDDASITNLNISFKEGRDEHNRPTLCPRLLAFDKKSNFGTLTRSPQEETPNWHSTWHGDVFRQEHDRIPQSEYHSFLDLEDSNDQQAEPTATKIRFWSDFSRVFFDPKSIQPVPDVLEVAEGDWDASCDSFSRYDDYAELMDGPLRLLMEECNNFQGLQMIEDTSTFGGFSNSLLSTFREEHPKATVMAFSCLSGAVPHTSDIKSSQIKAVLNDTFSLRSLAEFCDLTVPILSPYWGKDCWFPGYYIDEKPIYSTSAILSAHIESATLPLRLQDGFDNLHTMAAHLNWTRSSPFAALCGTVYPQGLFTQRLEDIGSLSFHANGQTPFARRDVSRGLSQDDIATYNTWSSAYELKQPLLLQHHLPSYPIPTSFAPVFPGARPKVLKMVSSLSTSPIMGSHLSNYARFVESIAKRRDSALLATRLEEDEIRELVGALWDIVDGYGESEGSDYLGASVGDDE